MKKLIVLLTLVGIVSLAFAEEAAEDALDYGDHSSVTLMVKAWEALGERNYEAAVKYADRNAELYEEKAREMQASLTSKPKPEVVNDYWALNDVGTTYFIKGEALTKLRRQEEALAAYKVVADELYYSQAWDPKGWHWSPSDAAMQKMKMLKVRKANDF